MPCEHEIPFSLEVLSTGPWKATRPESPLYCLLTLLDTAVYHQAVEDSTIFIKRGSL